MKIFCAVGNMNLNFGRFVEKIFDLDRSGDHEIVFQSGFSEIDHLQWCHTVFHPFLSGSDFSDFIDEADLVICHAGVGVITDCLKIKKMPIVFARTSHFNEHVNDHQVDFVSRYVDDGLFYLIDQKTNVVEFINNLDLTITPSRFFLHDLRGLREEIHFYLRKVLSQ